MGPDLPLDDDSRARRMWRQWRGRISAGVVGLAAVCGIIGWNLTDNPFVDNDAHDEPVVATEVKDSAEDRPYTGGWGPERRLFTIETPAPYAAINSITNNPRHGDERVFVRVKQASASDATYANTIHVEPGDEVELYAYFGNSAADNLTTSAGTLWGLRAHLHLPQPGRDLPVAVVLGADNARDVWDGATLIATVDVKISVEPGSGRVFTNALGSEGVSIDTAELTSEPGALLGYDALDGKLPVGYDPDGNYTGAGYFSVRLNVHAQE